MKDWAESFYLSKRWRQTRDDFLKHKNLTCERCGEAATIAHHRIWLTKENINDVNLTLNWKNLEALCQNCHNVEHHSKKRKQKRYIVDENGNVLPPPL